MTNFTRFLLILVTSIFANNANAFRTDTSITTLNNVHQGYGGGLATRTVIDTFYFPQNTSMYSEIKLRITLSCPVGGCDPWDRFANVKVYHEGEWFEIARYITPYGRACGWLADVSDYRALLKDTVIIKSLIDTWTNPGWLVKYDFEFIAGIPLHENIKIENLWYNENVVYGDNSNPAILPVVSKTIETDALNVKFKMVNTGHGQGNTDNAAEFSQKTHSLYVNGILTNSHLLWKNNCSTNPCSPQGGSWQYNRAGWCPGEDVPPVFFDLTSIAVPGQSINLDYRLQYYVNACTPSNPGCITGSTCADCNYNYNGHTEPHYKISGQLITYKSTNTGVNQKFAEKNLFISPNPASGLINLTFKKNAQEGIIELYDVTGNLIKKEKVNADSQTWDLSHLSKGIYFIKYYSEKSNEVSRIILK